MPLGVAFFLLILFGKNLADSRILKGFVLSDTQAKTISYHDTAEQLNALLHKNGVAITTLRPAGQIDIEGERYDAMADGAMVNKGEQVRVIDISGNILVVRKA